MATEPVEIASAVRFLEVNFTCERPFDVTREIMVQAASHSQFPDEIRTKYFRGQGFSVVQTIVCVKSGMGGFFDFDARVFVRTKYQGDMARISPVERAAVTHRLDELAQHYCADFVAGNFFEEQDIPLIPGWHGVPAGADGN